MEKKKMKKNILIPTIQIITIISLMNGCLKVRGTSKVDIQETKGTNLSTFGNKPANLTIQQKAELLTGEILVSEVPELAYIYNEELEILCNETPTLDGCP